METRAKFFHMKLNDANREKSLDGKRLSVRGYFTSDQKDAVGDIITKDATIKAIPDYKQWGNIRYMHQPKPVGVVRAIGEEDGLEWNEVVFDITKQDVIEDVENGLLKALSVGILVDWKDINELQDGGWVINNYKLAEISLVDHPANYDARLKGMQGQDALSYVKGLYNGTAKNVTTRNSSLINDISKEPDVVEEKSPPCRQEDESKDDCISRKIPELVAEGMDQDQAVAVANEMCSKPCEQKSIVEDTLMDNDVIEKNVNTVEDVADVELPETVTTDETFTEKTIEITDQEDDLQETANDVVESEKELDGNADIQAEETHEEPVYGEKDIISDDEIIVEDEFLVLVKSLKDIIIALKDEVSLMKNQIANFEVGLQEANTEAEIKQDVSDAGNDELDKGLMVGEILDVEPDVQKGAMPETEIIETETKLEEQPVQKATLRDVLKKRFSVE